jgi:arylsulfatase
MYAGQIDRFDWNVGRIVAHLKKHGMLDNTLIMFFSDNGCSGEMDLFGMNWKKYKSSNYKEWRKKGGWSISQGQCWACYSNTPFRKYKKFVHEGGIASPFIAHWPAGIKNPGRIHSRQFFHLVDIMPTLCEAAGAKYPGEYNCKKITPSEGISMLPFIKAEDAPTEQRTVCWQHENHAAIREDNWKLVTVNDRVADKWELYDLTEDRSETDNLVSSKADVAKRLKEKWTDWAMGVNALPFPEKRGTKAKGVPWPPRPWPEQKHL